jgi:hypothetical protein
MYFKAKAQATMTQIFCRIIAVVLLFCLSNDTTYGQMQGRDVWFTLGMVTFETKFDPEFMVETKIPRTSSAVEKLDGTVIEVEGYMIPLTGQVTQNHFILSKFPQSTCFFCGKAGPETAMQVFLANNRKVKISERKVKVKGILSVNPTDASSLLYTLENAEMVESQTNK